MSHLSKHMRKQSMRNVLLFIIGISILLIFFIQVGFRLLINGTLFINNALSGDTQETETKNNDNFFGTLNVDDIPAATNSAEIIVTGDAREFDIVEFYINNVDVKKTDIKNNAFEETIGALRTGTNTVWIIAKTSDGKHSRKSNRFTVVMKKDPPSLEITYPADNSTTDKQEITIEGSTDKGVTLQINNQPVVVDFQGNFRKLFRLKEGENMLEFRAVDEAGNVVEKSTSINYQKDD